MSDHRDRVVDVDVDGVEARGRVRLNVEDATSAQHAMQVDRAEESSSSAALFLNAAAELVR
jgi:hypothetical protein